MRFEREERSAALTAQRTLRPTQLAQALPQPGQPHSPLRVETAPAAEQVAIARVTEQLGDRPLQSGPAFVQQIPGQRRFRVVELLLPGTLFRTREEKMGAPCRGEAPRCRASRTDRAPAQ